MLNVCITLLLFFFGAFTNGNPMQEGEPMSQMPEPFYSVYMPREVRPGFELAATVTLMSSARPVMVMMTFNSSDGEVSFSNSSMISEGESQRMVLGRIYRSYSGSKRFTLWVRGMDSLTQMVLFENQTSDFTFNSKSLSILIQTDKAIYQPGQTIKFRAICMGPDLLPLTDEITYNLKNPKGNVVLLNSSMLDHGVAGSEFILNSQAMEGVWTITYTYQDASEMMSVTIQPYKLPKFEVKLSAPTVIHPKLIGITVNLKADYTFGQPVTGTARLQLEMKSQYGSSFFPPRFITKNVMKFEGEKDIFIPMSEMMSKFSWNGRSDQTVEVTGYVTETLTSTTLSKTLEIDVKRVNVKIDVLSKPKTVKPGLTYQSLVRVTEQNGMLLMEPERLTNHLILEVEYNYQRYNYNLSRPVLMAFVVQPNGMVMIDLPTRSDNFTSMRFRVYTNITASLYRFSNSWTATRALSPTNSFIQITPSRVSAQGDVTVGDLAQVHVRSNKMVDKVFITAMAKGKIVEVWDLSSNEWQNFTFLVTSSMTPAVTLIASYVTETKEVVADALTLDVALSLQNRMSITLSENSVDAGSNVSVRIDTSAAGSYVGIRAVDQSILLLKSGNDITETRVVSELEKYGKKSFYSSLYRFSYSVGAKDAEEVFRDIDVNVLTNGLVYDYQPPQSGCSNFDADRSYGKGNNFNGRIIASAFSVESTNDDSARSRSKLNSPSSRIRNFFPETWLWTSGIAKSDGSVEFNAKAPDTITSWEISAFSMSNIYGLGIAGVNRLTVFRNFFVSLNLPLKITRGEIIIVQAIVFNYFSEDLTATIQLHVNSKFLGVDLLHPGDDPTIGGPIREHVIPAGGSVSVKFPLRMNILGEYPVQVSATSSLGMDRVVRNVFVKPEGIQQCYSSSVLFRSSTEGDKQMVLSLPSAAIPGSGKVRLHTYGDILGSTMSNLGKLLRVPGGCGEQNMIYFAPDVFVTLYLQRVGKLDLETRIKAFQHIRDGYSNEMRFRHRDGSFSAFGERDEFGSTWLTAFVIKCFIYAYELDQNLVEELVIVEGMDFLMEQQNSDGSFKEKGKVINKALQGGVNSPITMTAYVLITLLDMPGAIKTPVISDAVLRARQYLESTATRSRDPYTLSITAYALHLAESTFAERMLTELEALSQSENGYVYWNDRTFGASVYDSTWSPPYTNPSSKEIEITSYVILNYMRRNSFDTVAPVLKWLVSKQNELGGYTSTQDTVIAVQALSQAAMAFSFTEGEQLSLTVTHSNLSSFMYQVTIDETTSVVYNTVEVAPVNGILTISPEGSGVAVAQLSVCYNIPTEPYAEEPFQCDFDVVNATRDIAKINFCCSLQPDSAFATGMFLFEIDLLNGFTVDVLDEERRNPMAKLVELDEDSVNIYYDELTPNEKLCANVWLLRQSEVASVKPATVKAFEYYKPEKKVVRLYSVEELNETGVCDVCGYECLGCPAPTITDWNKWTPCVKFCESELSTRDKSCFDPGRNKIIDFFRCGVEVVPMEIRSCNKTFSCPDKSESLWMELPSSYNSFRSTSCSLVGGWRRSPWTVIPGTMLNGNNQYLRCSMNIFGNNFTPKSNPNIFLPMPESLSLLPPLPQPLIGFTISFLVKSNFYELDAPLTFFAVSEQRDLSFVVLEKPLQKQTLRFSVSIKNKRDIVENISLSNVPAGVWSHVILTWSSNMGGKVIINGMEVGDSISVNVASSREMNNKPFIYLGSKPAVDKSSQGFFSGSFSALHMWKNMLPMSELEGLYEYYEEIINFSGPEPLLSIRHLREFSPPQHQVCFSKATFLSRIYAKKAICKF